MAGSVILYPIVRFIHYESGSVVNLGTDGISSRQLEETRHCLATVHAIVAVDPLLLFLVSLTPGIY